MIQRSDMDAPVDSSCLEMAEVTQKRKIRLGLSKKPVASLFEGDIEELSKSFER